MVGHPAHVHIHGTVPGDKIANEVRYEISQNIISVCIRRFFSENVTKKFSKIILETLKYRRENNIRREDFLDMLIDMKSKESEYPFDDEDILSHAVGFYGDGFETSAITLTFLLYELATNLDVQKKLRDEVDEMMEKHSKDITYDVIQSMKYLDMVFWGNNT